MVKSAKKIVILRIRNIGFSILKQLNNINDSPEIIAIARRFSTYLEDCLSEVKDNIKLTFIEANKLTDRIVKAESLGRDILIIPFKSGLFLLLESQFYPLFKKLILK